MNLKQWLGIDGAAPIGTTSSSEISGSPTFDEIPFHVEVGCRPPLGGYVVVTRAEPDSALHYGRIVEGMEINGRADPFRMQQNRAYQVGVRSPRPGELAPHVARTMAVEILGEVHEHPSGTPELKEPAALPQTGMPVYELPAAKVPWLLQVPDSPDDGLHLGHIEFGNNSVDFILPMEALARHIAVVGKTGVGKSYSVGVLIEELARHGIPVVSFDVLGDVVNAASDLGGINLRAGESFKVPYSVIGLSEFMEFTSNLTREQSELVALAYDNIYGQALGQLQQDGAVSVPASRLEEAIRGVAADFDQAAVGTRAIRRVTAAIGRNKLLGTETLDWREHLSRYPVVNIFVGHLSQRLRNLTVGATARMLQTFRRDGRIPPFVLILDEAHLFLPSGDHTPSTSVVRELVRTARHDAIGIILITQSPSSMDRQVLLTCNTRLVFALDRDDLRVIGGTLGDLPEAMVNRIPKLAKSKAILSSGMDIMRHPAQIRVRKRLRTREGAPTPNLAEEVSAWRRRNR